MYRWQINVKSYSISSTREIKMKTRHHYTPIRILTIKNNNIKGCYTCTENSYSYTTGGNLKWYSHSGKHFSYFFFKTTHVFTIWSNNHTPGIHLSEMKTCICIKTCTQLFVSALFNSQNWK